MTSYPHLQMIKTRYKYVEEPAQGCVDKKSIYFRTEADASGQGFDNLLRTPFQLAWIAAPLVSICTSWKVSGLLSCWLSWGLFSPSFAPTAHCTHCFLPSSFPVPETGLWSNPQLPTSLILCSSPAKRCFQNWIFLSYFHPGLHQFLLRLLKRKLNVYYTPANYGPSTGHLLCIPSVVNIPNNLLFSHFTSGNAQLVLL